VGRAELEPATYGLRLPIYGFRDQAGVGSVTTLTTTGADVAPATSQVWNYAHAVFETAATRGALAILPTFDYQRRLVVVLHIIWLIILGLVVGLIARAIVPGRQPMGWIATAVLGIVGAYVGGTLGSVVFPPHQFDVHPPINHSFLGALVGAVLLLWIFKLVTSRTRTL
jgi:uncharacterized membrane protein YeaQ/YmgE (transglycosylase-associated protein family)